MRAHYLLPALLLVVVTVHAAPSPMVRVSEVREMSLSEPIIVGGVIRARSDVLLPATLEGELEWVAEEGTHVSAGTVVARIDSTQLALRKREQELLAERARINHRHLTEEVDRVKALQQSNLVSQTQLAELVSRRDLAGNDVDVAMMRISQLEDQLARARIVSPVDAVVVERRVNSGEYARLGEPVLRVVDAADLEVVITIPMTWAGRIEAGRQVLVQAEDVEFTADVRAIIGAGNAGSQTFRALATVPVEVAPLVISGQMAEVSVPLSLDHPALVVPRDAVVLRADGNYVYRIDENNVAERISVALGQGQGDVVSVTGELNAGDRIAVRGVERLTDGQTISPTQS